MSGEGRLKLGGDKSVPTIISEMIRTPNIDKWDAHIEPVAPTAQKGEVRAVFLGVSTVFLRDDTTAILTDGFFSRPGIIRFAAGKVRPDRRRINAALRLADIDRLDAVFVVHSHVDHALDSATVAQKTGAWLIGSESTRQISRGVDFPQERFMPAHHDQPVRFGSFTLTAVHAAHSPDDLVPGEIIAPITPPAKTAAYRTGECYSLFVEHPRGTVLIHASAGFVPGVLAGRHADTVYLGIGALGTQSNEYREAYWRETVEAVGARRVIPIHWDNFTRRLDRPLRPLPEPFDNVARSLEWLDKRARSAGVTFAMPRLGHRVDPWPG